MRKLFSLLIAIVIIAVAVWFVRSHMQMTKNVESTTTPSTLNTDIYPLYSGVEWNKPDATEIDSVPTASTTNIAEVADPFLSYYNTKLTKLGWVEDTSRQADGAVSSSHTYIKGEQSIILGYTSAFANEGKQEPAQCPCRLTFRIASKP